MCEETQFSVLFNLQFYPFQVLYRKVPWVHMLIVSSEEFVSSPLRSVQAKLRESSVYDFSEN